MKQRQESFTVTGKYVLACATAVLFTWLIHEFAHWVTGEVLGNAMTLTLNASYPESGHYVKPGHDRAVSAAGPLVTLLQAVVFYPVLKRKARPFLYPFLFVCLYMRLLAAVLNVINLNDEGRISTGLHLGTYTVSLVVCAVLFYFTYRISNAYRLKTKFIAATTLWIMFFSSILILGDQALHLKLL
ncbi:MAG TPA: hypothetical protein VM010_00025 [Chitinophagaceae bacterium]|nr:hypothetical protein [Chitinophagaceae bacterium]